ncbi:MAG: PAS domain S-box protein, partial [Promethearchaeota archaeon]
HDITDKRISEQIIKESEEKYRNLFNNAPFVIVLFNIEGVILDCNNATHKITGYSKEELIGNNYKSFNFYVNPTSANLEERLKQTDQGKLPEEREIKLYRKDGTQFWAKTQIEFIKLKNETCIQAIIHDITDKKKSEIALNLEKKFVDDILNSSMDTIFVFNPATGNALRWNKVFAEVTGYTDEEIVSMKAPYSYYSSEDLQLAAEATKKVLEGKKLTFEMTLITKDGRKIPYEYTGTTFTNSDGKVIIVSIGRDLTERKEAEKKRILAQKELEKSYEKLQELEKIINNSPSVGILWKNAEGWPVEFVSENVNQWGYSPEDFYSGTVKYAEIIHPDDLEKVSQEVVHYSNEDINEFVQEYRIVTKSGEVKWIDDRTWIRRDSEGNITHFQGVVLDTTDRKIAEEALKESEKKFKKAYDQASFYKDLFTHDINNILQVVNSSAELISYQLGNSEKSKDISNIADIIKKQVDRGSKLVSNVRTLSIIEDEVISTKTIDISRFLENSIDFIKKAYEERNVNITVDGLNGIHKINANELIQDVFENILINAIKYNENPNVEIAIRLSKIKMDGNENFKIEFIDNGIGVSDDRKVAIFRSGNRELKGSKGMGLGLSLVSKIINLFKGRIWHEDKVKGDYTQGSNFIIVLPEAK